MLNFKMATKIYSKNIIKAIIAIAALTILVIDIQSSWTDWPHIDLQWDKNPPSNVQVEAIKVADVYTYLQKYSVFAYFTILSNILLAIVVFISWVLNIRIQTKVRLIFLVYMFITAIVFWTSLAPFIPWGRDKWFDFTYIWEHLCTFIIAVLWAFEDKDDKPLKFKWIWVMSFPIVYLTFNIIMFAFVDQNAVVYPFLNFANWFGLGLNQAWSYILTIVSIIGISLLFMGSYWVFNIISSKLNKWVI